MPPSLTPQTPRPTVGVGIVIIRETAGQPEVVLIRRGRPPGEGVWSIPGGHLETGETVREGAVREAAEETGLQVTGLKLVDVVDVVLRHDDKTVNIHWTLVDFCGTVAGGELCAGSDAAAARWVALSDLEGYDLWEETLRIIRTGVAMVTGDEARSS